MKPSCFLELEALNPRLDSWSLDRKLSVAVRERHPRNWMLVLLLIKYVLPVIIELVIEWWNRRQSRLAAEKKGGWP